MSLALACTFRPINDIDRFRRLRPAVQEVTSSIVLVTPPGEGAEPVLSLAEPPVLQVVVSSNRAVGRYVALRHALAADATHVLCADLDRLMRWVEVAPDEWLGLTAVVQRSDCLVVGRTDRAFQTHPQALQQTERVINAVFSELLGASVDLGGGARGFSRAAAQFVVAHAEPEAWSDAAWPILAQRGGFRVDYLALDCNDWETADRYLGRSADPDTQRHEAEKRDQDPKQWSDRVRLAHAIIEAGLEARRRPLSGSETSPATSPSLTI
jgi:hypothetical protein